VGSTTQLIDAVGKLPTQRFIVATDQGILHEMRARYPDKQFMAAPTAGTGASCKSCAFCPWMAMNQLDGVEQVLHHGQGAITLEPALMAAARRPLERMLAFAATRRQRVRSSGEMEQDMALFTHFGAA
jgi:quinolinate synthase